MTYVWLIESPGDGGTMYLSTAISETSCGFTEDPFKAWRFPSKGAAELVAKTLNLSTLVVEHSFEESPFLARQALCKDSGTRYYGDGGTIHGTKHLNVETDSKGNVVAVWFRCQPLPFEQVVVRLERAHEMRRMYTQEGRKMSAMHGVEVRDFR